MNLITCSEDCSYQKDGSCHLSHPATVTNVRANGCSYFVRRKPRSSDGKANVGKKNKKIGIKP